MQVPKRRYDKNPQEDFDPYITQAKADEIKINLDKMVKHIRPKLIKEVEEHAKLGDFSENAAYQLAKGKLRGLNNRILVMENTLNKAKIIKPQKNSKEVDLGNKVTVQINNNEFVYQILGAQETDPDQGIISRNSPIGAGLLGHSLGDEVEIEIDDRVIKYKILKIE